MIEGYQKVSKVYDSLMKSGAFTAAQNKQENGEIIDSVGELIAMCEQQGYIERYYIDQPHDKVDFTIQDMQRYTRTLIENETNLNEMLEQSIKMNQQEDAANKDEEFIDEESGVEEEITEISQLLDQEVFDQDFVDFDEFQEEEELEDKNDGII